MVWLGRDGINYFKINIINGCRVDPNFFMGVGTGLKVYNDYDIAYNPIIPLFLNIRSNFKEDGFSPYISTDIGSSFKFNEDYLWSMGLYFSPSFGIRYSIYKQMVVDLSIGYEMKTISQSHYPNKIRSYYWRGSYNNTSKVLENLGINVGFSF